MAFGSCSGMMNPATSHSVADSLALVDTAVNAVREERDPVAALWPWQARLVRWMRLRQLGGLGRLTTDQSIAMFESFFQASRRVNNARCCPRTTSTRRREPYCSTRCVPAPVPVALRPGRLDPSHPVDGRRLRSAETHHGPTPSKQTEHARPALVGGKCWRTSARRTVRTSTSSAIST